MTRVLSLARTRLSAVLAGLALVTLAGCTGGGTGGTVTEVQGSGASFPDPLYQVWFATYSKDHPEAKVEYASKGSGTGIKEFIDGLTDFGASDAAMSEEEQAQVPGGVILLPMTAGSIVICYNLKDTDGKDIPDLKLSRDAYTGIFLGTVKTWDDKAIADANPGVKLPSKPVQVVYRSDSSGTTYVFTQHLSAVSEEFSKTVGTDKSPAWPTGSAAPKNDGVAGAIKANDGTIGYVELGFAEQNGIPMAMLENKSGKYIKPSQESGAATLASIKEWPEDLIVWLPDPDGEDSYPIVTYTWILCRKEMSDAKVLEVMKDCFKYCLTEGQKASGGLGYIPLPEEVQKRVIAQMDKITVSESAPAEKTEPAPAG